MEIWYEITTHGDICRYRKVNERVYVTYLGNGITSSLGNGVTSSD